MDSEYDDWEVAFRFDDFQPFHYLVFVIVSRQALIDPTYPTGRLRFRSMDATDRQTRGIELQRELVKGLARERQARWDLLSVRPPAGKIMAGSDLAPRSGNHGNAVTNALPANWTVS